MKRIPILFVFLVFAIVINLNGQTKSNEENRIKFNPKADPAADLKAAVAEATKMNKRIILDVGGEWCIWCHRLDNFIDQNEQINKFIHEKFITVKINYSEENYNEKFLSEYPKIKGYPHMFVLDKNGEFLHSQDTGLLARPRAR